MKKIHCDICDTTKNVETRYYRTGTRFDGVESVSKGESFDLCNTCELKALRQYIKEKTRTAQDEYTYNSAITFILYNSIQQPQKKG